VSDTWNLDLSASAVGIQAGVNAGDSTTDIDLFDVNGDRYPDSVTSGGVQSSDGIGSFSGRQQVDMGFGDVRSTANASLRFGLSSCVAGQLINLSNSGSETKMHVSTDVVSATTDYGVSSTRVDFLDLNGDGLLDHVARKPSDSGIHVRLNLGYGFGKEILCSSSSWQRNEIPARFLAFEPTGGVASYASPVIKTALGAIGAIAGESVTSTKALRFSDTQTNNLSVGIPGQTFGAGGGPNASLTRSIVDLVDLNGDGLPDQMMRAPDEAPTQFRVKLNLGDHFGPEAICSIPTWRLSAAVVADVHVQLHREDLRPDRRDPLLDVGQGFRDLGMLFDQLGDVGEILLALGGSSARLLGRRQFEDDEVRRRGDAQAQPGLDVDHLGVRDGVGDPDVLRRELHGRALGAGPRSRSAPIIAGRQAPLVDEPGQL